MSGFPTLASVLDQRRIELGLSVNEVGRRAAMPLATTQRRFRDATGATYGELVRIVGVLGLSLSAVLADVEEQQGAIVAAAHPAGTAAA
jgi:hypothetical protein